MNVIKKIEYRRDIDGLRAIAVLSVLIFHAFPEWLSGGYVGVSIFFVISGYLITSILLRGIHNNNLNIFSFFAGRVKRIFPSLITVLFSTLVIGYFTLLPNELKELGKYVAASALFAVNFLEMFQAGYFDFSSDYKPLLHIWSLGIEEQFYIFWPVYILTINRWRVSFTKAIFISLLASFLINIFLQNIYPIYNFYLPISRFFEILAGASLATLQFNKKTNLVSNATSIFGIFLLLISILIFDRDVQYPGYAVLLPILGTVLIIYAGEQAFINKCILGNSALIWFGLISYPLYLWHWMLLSYSRIISSSEPPFHYRLMIVLSSILLSWLTYKYIEKPIRNSRSKVVTPSLIFTLLIIGASVLLIKIYDGFPSRVKPYLLNYHANNSIKAAEKFCIQLTKVDARYCRLDNPLLKPTVALIGDSIADGLYDALAQKYRADNGNLILIGNAGCLPMHGVDTVSSKYINDCQAKNEKIYSFLKNNENIKTVIFSFWGNYYYSGHDILHPEKITSNIFLGDMHSSREDIFKKSFFNTAKILASYGKRMLLISNAPEFLFDPRACVGNFRPYSSIFVEKPECSQPKQLTNIRNQAYLSLIKKLAESNKFDFIDLEEILCNENSCNAAINGQLIYRDYYHLNTFGAEYVVNKLWERINNF